MKIQIQLPQCMVISGQIIKYLIDVIKEIIINCYLELKVEFERFYEVWTSDKKLNVNFTR